MNETTIKVKWKQLRAKLKTRWVKLTDDDLQVPLDGNRDYLASKLQEHYGIATDEARQQVDDFYAASNRPSIDVREAAPHRSFLTQRMDAP